MQQRLPRRRHDDRRRCRRGFDMAAYGGCGCALDGWRGFGCGRRLGRSYCFRSGLTTALGSTLGLGGATGFLGLPPGFLKPLGDAVSVSKGAVERVGLFLGQRLGGPLYPLGFAGDDSLQVDP